VGVAIRFKCEGSRNAENEHRGHEGATGVHGEKAKIEGEVFGWRSGFVCAA
jgi:hypothetical protein